MAHLLPCCSSISKTFSTELPPNPYKASKFGHGSWKFIDLNWVHVGRNNGGGCLVYCSSSASATSSLSSGKQVFVEDRRRMIIGEGGKEEELENLVSEFGWKVRRLVEEDQNEMREVAHVQAEAFHSPVALFDDLFFQFFRAEVLSALIYKLRNSPPDRYACLVAEPTADSSIHKGKLVGVVDVTASSDGDVLQHLTGAHEYLYVSGMAVSQHLRRQKIATVLLKACDVLSVLWGFEYLVLRAYEDDVGARKLYAKAGYRVVASDPQWLAWTGRRRRVLMTKRSKLVDQSL